MTNESNAVEGPLEHGCSLREQAHEQEFERVKYDLHATNIEWNNAAFAAEERSNGDEEFLTETTSVSSLLSSSAFQEMRRQVAADMMGHDKTFLSPLEWKPGSNLQVPLVYCDFTASSRPLQSIEEYLQTTCVPFYGNTHTNTSVTGSQSSAFVSEARQIIAEACNAKITGKASQDVVLFAGNGTSAAVQLLIDCLGLKHYKHDNLQKKEKPLIILGPFEHHSNMLPWRELGFCNIETVGLKNGNVDLSDLERILQKYQHRRSIKIGSFSAASNVTGTVVDDLAVTAILHRYNALSVWDFATGASYLEMNMNPTPVKASHVEKYGNNPASFAKDAIFFSGHKLLGGVGTPGVLIAKKTLVSSLNPPENCGGGTVFYVTDDHHRFLSNRIERYEGGTPNVIGIWRLGLVFRFKLSLKAAVKQITPQKSTTTDKSPQSTECFPASPDLMACDLERASVVQRQLKQIPNLVLLDGTSPDGVVKVPVFSFLIKCGTRFLHYNYVCALLNDVFGIQSRGGCQCAGPYSQYLLGMVEKDSDKSPSNPAVEHWLVHTKDELLRPGATRLSLPTLGTTEEQQDYVVEAIRWIASNGWRMMHVYRCNHRTGEFRHKSRPGAPLGTCDRLWLSHYQTLAGSEDTTSSAKATTPIRLSNTLHNADKMLTIVLKDQSSIIQALKMAEEETDSSLRWYVYPKDVARFVQNRDLEVPETSNLVSIQGAVYPLALQTKPTSASGFTTDIEEETVSDNAESASIANLGNLSSKLAHFRDGEHTGQAPLNEILEGLEEGELSAEQCQIFDESKDEWVSTSILLESIGFALASEVKKKSPQDAVESLNGGATELRGAAVEFAVDDVPHIDKNNNKKPARGSTVWGQGEMHQIPPSLSRPRLNGDMQQNGDGTVGRRGSKAGILKPPPKLLRLVTQAMIQWDMLQDGDRLLLGLSGGKDSLSLLHILLHFQRKLPIRFEIEVCTIDPMTPSFDPSPLISYVESLGLKYHYIRDEIVERASRAGKDGKIVSSLCAYCARMKRGNLYTCARANKCNKLVLAQHLDDLAESFMMSVMHNGFLRTMKANYKINAGDLSVIRPLAYCREALMADFARSASLPIINENCPACFEEPKERARMKKLLSKEETLYPNFYDNIKRAMLPLMHDDATAILRSYTEEVLAKSRKDNQGKKGNSVAANGLISEVDTITAISAASLATASDEDLLRELACRRAERHRLAGAMAPRTTDDDNDPTGQVCTLNGGDGSIPCAELME